MNNQENHFETRDFGLMLFIAVAGWFLLFQSGLIG